MAPRSHAPLLDRLAVGLSGLCVLHCVLGVVLVSTLSLGGAFFADPHIHEFGLMGAVALGAVALGQGYLAHRAIVPACIGAGGLLLMTLGLLVPHGWGEVVLTIAGVCVLALGHVMNVRARA